MSNISTLNVSIFLGISVSILTVLVTKRRRTFLLLGLIRRFFIEERKKTQSRLLIATYDINEIPSEKNHMMMADIMKVGQAK
jgi:hypothetical protein